MILLSGLATLSLAIGATGHSMTIHDNTGVLVSEGVPGTQTPAATLADVIDRWQGDTEIYEWGINTTFYWATAFQTNGISEAHDVTEIRWYASGTGVDEEYWIAPDTGGQPDVTNATYLGQQFVGEDGWDWHSYDASDAGVSVDAGQVYWLIRAKVGLDGFDMTWRSTTNPSPPVDNPVWISQNWESGWGPWVTGSNWHMEYEILGNPADGDCDLAVVITGAPQNVTRGGQLRFDAGAENACEETLFFDSAIMDIAGPASLIRTLYDGASAPVPAG